MGSKSRRQRRLVRNKSAQQLLNKAKTKLANKRRELSSLKDELNAEIDLTIDQNSTAMEYLDRTSGSIAFKVKDLGIDPRSTKREDAMRLLAEAIRFEKAARGEEEAKIRELLLGELSRKGLEKDVGYEHLKEALINRFGERIGIEIEIRLGWGEPPMHAKRAVHHVEAVIKEFDAAHAQPGWDTSKDWAAKNQGDILQAEGGALLDQPFLRMSNIVHEFIDRGDRRAADELRKMYQRFGSNCPTHGDLRDPIVTRINDQVAFICPDCSGADIKAKWKAETPKLALGFKDPWGIAWQHQHPDLADLVERLAAAAHQGIDSSDISKKILSSPRPPPGFAHAFSGLGNDWSDKELMRLGLIGWDHYRRVFSLDTEKTEAAIDRDIARLYSAASADKRQTACQYAQFAVAWAEWAFQKILTSHTFAAALMCSDAAKQTLEEDIVLPWRAFLVNVPNGMLEKKLKDGRIVDYDRITFHVHIDGLATLIVYSSGPKKTGEEGSYPAYTISQTSTLTDVLYTGPDLARSSMSSDEEVSDSSLKILKLAKRLVVGLLLSMQHTLNFKTRTVAARYTPARKLEAPEHRITTIGRPLKVDCRGAVRDYLFGAKTGKKGPLAYQVLVRGHYKRQVVGVARSGRKVIWVEPYWRGPDDGPILTRPKMVP